MKTFISILISLSIAAVSSVAQVSDWKPMQTPMVNQTSKVYGEITLSLPWKDLIDLESDSTSPMKNRCSLNVE